MEKELAGLCTFIILSNAMGSLSVRADESISGKLTVWEHSITFEMPMEMLVSGFEEKYPNVDVEWEIWDMENYYDLVSLGIQAGSGAGFVLYGWDCQNKDERVCRSGNNSKSYRPCGFQ